MMRPMKLLVPIMVLFVPAIVGGQSVSDSPAASPPARRWSPGPLFSVGTPSPDSIRVGIFGYSVKQPGYYFLPRGATVRDALAAAKIDKVGREIGWQRPYSGVQRQKADGSLETIWFAYSTRASDEQIRLQDGDWIRFSHEVY